MAIYAHKNIRPSLGARVFVAPNASVIGDVTLGSDSSIWFGAVLRGDCFPITIGARSNIQDNAVVHVTGDKARTVIGDDVTVGHLALVHGCTIGNGCLIGMGSIILDNAVVEDESVIAAGALVPPGMRVPSRSLVMGRPGKVVRTLSDSDLEWVKEAGRLYVQYAREFMETLVEIS